MKNLFKKIISIVIAELKDTAKNAHYAIGR